MNSRDLETPKTRLFPKVKLTDGGTPCPLLPPWGDQRNPKVQAAANRWLWGQLCQSLVTKQSEKKVSDFFWVLSEISGRSGPGGESDLEQGVLLDPTRPPPAKKVSLKYT